MRGEERNDFRRCDSTHLLKVIAYVTKVLPANEESVWTEKLNQVQTTLDQAFVELSHSNSSSRIMLENRLRLF